METVIEVCLIITCVCNAINIYLMLKRIEKLEVQADKFKINLIGLMHRDDLKRMVKECADEEVSGR